MPILAAPGGYAVSDEPEVPGPDFTDSRYLDFRRLDGTYPFPSSGGEFVFMPDAEGLDIPPRELVTKRLPGLDGARLKEIRTNEREVFLPIWIASWSSHLDYLTDRDTLAGLFQYRNVDYRTEEGTLDLVATSARGERSLRCTYVSGMSAVKKPNESAHFAKLGITLLACRPYWYGESWSTPVIRQSGTEPDFFADGIGDLSASVALGADIELLVEGDVPSWPTVDLVGPADDITITGDGLLVSIPDGLADGEVAQIVTDPRGRTALFAGAVDWSRVGALTTWQPLDPGVQLLDIVATGAGANTTAVVTGHTLWERPW